MSSPSDHKRQTDIPALGETDLDDPDSLAETSNDKNILDEEGRTYQDDLDYKDTDVDPIINEETDSPAEVLRIPEEEFKNELDKYADDDIGTGDDDMRETIEDRDEDDDNSASAPQ
jgi:hypothetical protein